MADATGSNVTITLNGLMCLALDTTNNLAKIDINTAAEGHILKLRLPSPGGQIERKVLSQERLKELSPLHIYVSEGGNPIARNVSGNLGHVLDLASSDFYKTRRDFRPDRYGCSIWVTNGNFDSGELEDCYRVKANLFSALKFEWECEKEWEGFQLAAKQLDPDAIRKLALSARVVKLTIPLLSGQSLSMISKKTGEIIFGPFVFGPGYDVSFDYVDIDIPSSLADCRGFAHHTESLQLNDDEPIFGIFRPSKFKDQTDSTFSTVTEPGCCELCSNNPNLDLQVGFQESTNINAQAARSIARSTRQSPAKSKK